ncbi:MAG: FAD-binding protein, partial [Candidatus Acidiferrales bacterium]
MPKGIELATVKIQEEVPLAEHSNYRIGGPARYFCEAANEEEIRNGVLFAREQRVPLFILGGGTNLLIDDSGFKGLVLKVNVMQLAVDGQTMTVGAGMMVS